MLEIDPVTLEVVWTYDARRGHDLSWSPLISGAQRLPNGNTLITSGIPGRLIEVTPDHRIVWDYRSEFAGLTPATYRAIRVPPEYLPVGANQLAGDYPAGSGAADRAVVRWAGAGPGPRPRAPA